MPRSGTELGVDLNRLSAVVGMVSAIADDYGTAAVSANKAADMNPFQRNAYFGKVLGPACIPWLSLLAETVEALVESQQNMYDTATALTLAIDGYASADTQAGDEFNRLRTGKEHPS